MFIKLVFFNFVLIAQALAANVVTTLPEFKWIAEALLPEAKTLTLLQGNEDPHFVDATPAFIFKVAKADVLIMNGMQLEIGWLPNVIQLSGNAKVQVGATGLCDASLKVKKIQVIENYNRSMGDVHPMGNPHYTLSPLQMMEVVDTIADCLGSLGDKKNIAQKAKVLKERLQEISKLLTEKLKDRRVYVYHREFQYLASDYKLNVLQSLEEVPGVLPSATFLSHMATKAQEDKPLVVLAAMTSPEKILVKFKELSKISYVKLRLHPKEDQDYLDFMKEFLNKITHD
jgi:zinc/manganese transport system substrate-binding protein